MKKRLHLLFAAWNCLFAATYAQKPDNDTTVISKEMIMKELNQQSYYESQNTKLNFAKSKPSSYTRDNVWERNKYRNIAYVMQTLKLENNSDVKWKSEYAFALTMGCTYYLHKKPIANILKVGIDWTYLDVNYAKYKTDFPQYQPTTHINDYSYSTYQTPKCHQVDAGMQIGPSLTINPVNHLMINGYFRYAPTGSMIIADKKVCGNYASFFVSGGSISYKVISIGIEARWGNAQYNKFNIHHSPATPNNSWIQNAINQSNHKFKTNSVRFYISLRF